MTPEQIAALPTPETDRRTLTLEERLRANYIPECVDANYARSLERRLAAAVMVLKEIHAKVSGDKIPRWADEEVTYYRRLELANLCSETLDALEKP